MFNYCFPIEIVEFQIENKSKVSPLNIPAWRDFSLRDQLAEATGLNRKTIMELEAGRDVRLSTVIKVFRVMHLLGILNTALPDTLPGGEALSARGQPRVRAYRLTAKKTN